MDGVNEASADGADVADGADNDDGRADSVGREPPEGLAGGPSAGTACADTTCRPKPSIRKRIPGSALKKRSCFDWV